MRQRTPALRLTTFAAAFAGVAVVIVVIPACGRSAAPSTQEAAATTPAASPATSPGATFSPATASAMDVGTVDGHIATSITFTTVVVLEPKTPRTFPPSADKAVMDQAQTTFVPDLLLVRTSQPVEFRNSDDTLHNVHVTHVETKTPAFNVAIPTGASYEYTFDRDGFYHVGCDIHTAMSASIFASSSPFVTTAEQDGRFTFSDVPAGAWTVTVYAGDKRLTADVEVHRGVSAVTLP